MNVVYAKSDYIERENKRHINNISSVLSTCTSLDIYCSVENDALGIWLDVAGKRYLVDPLDLVNSIFEDEAYYMLQSYQEEDKRTIIVEVRKDEYCFSWRLFDGGIENSITRYFGFQEYVNKIKSTIEKFRDEWRSGKRVAYDKIDVKIESVETAAEQLALTATMPSYYSLRTSDIKEEEFVFDVLSHKDLERYSIGIGNRKFSTCITHWDNNFDKIRHQFENFYYEKEAKIEFSFDMSKTIIKIRKVSIVDEIDESEKCCGFSYKDYVLVEIIPNDFVRMPIIKGYCDLSNTIKSLYEGLLLFALKHPLKESIDNEPLKHEIYNMLKSPLIEKAIADAEIDYDKAGIRQYHIKSILKICPDYDAVLWDSENIPLCIDEEGKIDDIYDKQGNLIRMPDLLSWQKEIDTIVIASETGESYEKDWQDYHRRGLELARRLRSKLSTDFDLWYEAPFEDKSGTITKPMLIY